MNVPPVGDPRRAHACRALILAPREQLPTYPLQLTLDERRHRMLVLWESIEALKLARDSLLEVPHAHP